MNGESHPTHGNVEKPWFRSRSGIVFLAFAAIAAFFLLSEHRAHVFQVLPWPLVAACPLMHLFHRGHGGHHS
jgi:Protein of unknown function (DUF2933)